MKSAPAKGVGVEKGRRALRGLAWLALPLLVIWAWKDIPLARLLAVLAQLNLGEILLLAALNLGLALLFGLRWWFILKWLGYTLPYLTLAASRLAGFGVSYFTPGPQFGGEPLQVYLLHRRGIDGPAALASVTLDKLVELLANFTFLAVGLGLALAGGANLAGSWGLLALPAGLLCLPLGYLVALWSGRQPATGLLAWILNIVEKPLLVRLRQQVNAAERVAAGLFRQRLAAITGLFFFSLAVWGLALLEYWLMMRFLGLEISPTQALLALTAARAAFLLPLPGGAGVLEASQVLAMQQLGLDPVYGAGAGLLIRLRDVLLAGLGLALGARLLSHYKTIPPNPTFFG